MAISETMMFRVWSHHAPFTRYNTGCITGLTAGCQTG